MNEIYSYTRASFSFRSLVGWKEMKWSFLPIYAVIRSYVSMQLRVGIKESVRFDFAIGSYAIANVTSDHEL